MPGGRQRAGIAVLAAACALTFAGCGSGPGSGSTAGTVSYGEEGPSSVQQLDDCLAAQPEDRRLLRSTVNGSLSAPLELVGQGAPTGPLLNTEELVSGEIDGVSAEKEIASRMKGLGSPDAFTPYRSGAFAVYPAPRVETLGDFQPTVDACLPESSSSL